MKHKKFLFPLLAILSYSWLSQLVLAETSTRSLESGSSSWNFLLKSTPNDRIFDCNNTCNCGDGNTNDNSNNGNGVGNGGGNESGGSSGNDSGNDSDIDVNVGGGDVTNHPYDDGGYDDGYFN